MAKNRLIAALLGVALALWMGGAWAGCTSPNGGTGALTLNGTAYQYCNGTSWAAYNPTVSTTTCATTGQRQGFNDGYTYICDGSHWNNYATGTTKGSCSTKNRIDYISGHYCTCNGSQYIPWCLASETSGSAYAFGDNNFGEMGIGDYSAHTDVQKTISTTTIPFTGLTMGGWGWSCGVDTNGNAYCWGSDVSGAGTLGDGQTGDSQLYPVRVVSSTAISYTSISSGNYYTCALDKNGKAYCWGDNTYGELGNNVGSGISNVPVLVSNPTGSTFAQLSSGASGPCAITADHNLWCWGPQFNGAVVYNLPTQFTAGVNFTQVSSGTEHACTIDTNGQAYCYGAYPGGDIFGELGIGSYGTYEISPTAVVSTTGVSFTSISAGLDYTCGVASSGKAYCWGRNNTGQLGDGTTANRNTAVQVSATGLSFNSIVSMGNASYFEGAINDTTCATTTTGALYCWGAFTTSNTVFGWMHELITPPALTQIAAGQIDTCGLGTGGQAYCWGYGGNGEIGNGGTDNASPPTQVISTTNISFTQVTSGGAEEVGASALFKGFNCGIDSSGKAYCWGSGSYGELGYGGTTSQSTPMQVISTTNISYTQISAGGYHVCGVDKNGLAYCWGLGNVDQLGYGGTSNQSKPVKVVSTTVISYTQIAAGFAHTCAIDKNGKAYCWGDNSDGELGTGNTTTQAQPYKIISPSTAVFSQIYAGYYQSCAIDSSSKAYCWGDDATNTGRLGDGSSTSQHSPILVSAPGISFTQLTLNPSFTCALDKNKSLYCWGQTPFGYSSSTPSLIDPSTYTGSIVSFTSIAAGASWFCAMDTVSNTYCVDKGDFFRYHEVTGTGTTANVTPSLTTLPSGVVATSMTSDFFGLSCGFTGKASGAGGC